MLGERERERAHYRRSEYDYDEARHDSDRHHRHYPDRHERDSRDPYPRHEEGRASAPASAGGYKRRSSDRDRRSEEDYMARALFRVWGERGRGRDGGREAEEQKVVVKKKRGGEAEKGFLILK